MKKNKEIDPLLEFEKTRDDAVKSAGKERVSDGRLKRVVACLIFCIFMGVALFLLLGKFNGKQDEKVKENTPTNIPKVDNGRVFNIDPFSFGKESDNSNANEAKPTPPPVTVTVTPQNETVEEPQLDENGLTPEQAARQRKLSSGFAGAGEQSPDSTSDSSASSSSATINEAGSSENALSKSLSAINTVTVKATAKRSLDLILTRGNSIPCALDRNIDSTVAGQITCHTISDIYSSSGKVLLMERGTQFVGTYAGDMSQGMSRLSATWDRLKTPNNVFMSFSAPAIGAMGEGGISGSIDTQFGKRFGNTILLTTIQDVIANASTHLAKNTQNGNGYTFDNTSQASNDIATETLKNSINIPVILRKNAGEVIAIDVLQDLDFSSVYKIVER